MRSGDERRGAVIGGARRARALAALGMIAAALAGCESSAEKSAQLEKLAKTEQAHAAAKHRLRGPITHPSTKIVIGAASVLHSSEGAAAVVTLRNTSATALANIPIQISVTDAAGHALYTNTAAGLATSLVSVALLPAHGTLTWIDDQVQASGVPSALSAKIGEGEPLAATSAATAPLQISGAHLSGEPAIGLEDEGTVVNHSAVDQHELVIDAIARRGGAVVAAGRAVLPDAPAGGATRFELFFVGDPSGAQLEVIAPATTPG